MINTKVNITRFLGIVLILAAFFTLLPSLSPASQAETGVCYVKVGGTGTGTSWIAAMGDVQAAIEACKLNGGGEVRIAEGTYKPTSVPNGVGDETGPRYFHFSLRNGVTVTGGFAGTETDAEPIGGETILSGDLNGDDATVGIDENAYHVFYHPNTAGLDDTAVLQNVTVSGGNANGSTYTFYNGGGMYNADSSPTVTGCTFSGNTANFGGGMHNSSSSPTVNDCSFSGNTATSNGGGMFNSSGSPTVTGCTFSGNNAAFGGGMYNSGGSPTVNDCTFSENNADDGGGMYNSSGSPTVTGCTFSGNTATATDLSSGGGMYNASSSPTVTGCTFSGNNATNYGGGMYNYGSSPTVTGCTFSGNTATGTALSSGGGMYNASSSPTVTGCTFSGNTATSGGGMYSSGGSPTVTGCTFSGNNATYNGGGIFNSISSPTVTGCTFSGNTATGTALSSGGGMYNASSSPTVTGCTFFVNNATNYGGGMSNDLVSNPTVTGCTFSGNNADDGGGVSNSFTASPKISHTIISGNTAASNSDISGGTPEYRHTIVGSRICRADGVFSDTGKTSDMILYSDGTLPPGSPAVDAGLGSAAYEAAFPAAAWTALKNAGLVTGDAVDLSQLKDMAEKPRLAGSSVDIGAYEISAGPENLVGTLETDSAELSWDSLADADGYNVYQNGVKINAELITDTSYTAADLRAGMSYEFRVTAVFENLETAFSNAATVSLLLPYIPPPPDDDDWENPFTDVREGDWFYGDVEYVNENGLMNGTAADKFSPGLDVTRGMIISILWRFEGEPEPNAANPFTDVPSGSYFEKAISWAAENKIVDGYGGGRFGPDDPVTREQLAAMLYRYLSYTGTEYYITLEYLLFADEGDISDYAKNAVQVLYKLGVIEGTGNGYIMPKNLATRAEAAAMIHRLCEDVLK